MKNGHSPRIDHEEKEEKEEIGLASEKEDQTEEEILN